MKTQVLVILSLATSFSSFCNAMLDFTNDTELLHLLRIFYFNDKNHEILPMSLHALKKTDFDPSKRTVMYFHGYGENIAREPNSCEIVQTQVLKHNKNFNVLCLDYNSLAGILVPYPIAVKFLPNLAKLVGRYVNGLMDYYQMDDEKIILIGVSLGAQLAGLTGERTKQKLNIIGLDPAGPLFTTVMELVHPLNPGQGKFVQVIHTSIALGSLTPMGHADYYVNGGIEQPMCTQDFIQLNYCSHLRSITLFLETLDENTEIIGRKCKKWTLGVICTEWEKSYMGTLDIDTKASGNYLVIWLEFNDPIGTVSYCKTICDD